MKHNNMKAFLCALAIAGAGISPAFAADEKAAAEAPAAPAVQAAAPAPVNPTEALLKGLSLTLPDVQKAVEEGTFKNLSPEPPKPPAPEPEPIPEPVPEPEPIPEPEPEPEPEPAPAPKYTASQGKAANEISSDGAYDGMSYTSSGEDENALRVSMAYMTAKGSKIEKTGNTADTEAAQKYGSNAALLVSHGGHGSFDGASVRAAGTGATGVFGYSKGTYVNLTGSTVETSGDYGAAAAVAERAMMKLSGTAASTKGNNAPALFISDKGGIILAENSTISTEGKGSQAVYTNGDVTLTNTTAAARNTKAAVVKGNNTLTLESSTLEGNETGSVPYNIVLCADESAIGTMGSQQFSATDSTLISHSGGMFLVTGTHSRVTLVNTIVAQDPNLPVFTVIGNDGTNGWGEAGSNGGHLRLTLDGDTLNGNIVVDSISDVNLTVTNQSVWNGAVQIVPNAEGGEPYRTNADIMVAEGSVWNLTGDSAATSLINLGTIHFNGYKLTLADGTVLDDEHPQGNAAVVLPAEKKA